MASNIVPFPRRAANDNRSAPPPLPPALRALIVSDVVPDHCIVFEVEDCSQEPHFHRGDFVVIDTREREPAAGEMMLRQCADGSRQVVEVRRFDTSRCTLEGGAPINEPWWSLHWSKQIGERTVRWADFPLTTAGATSMIVGTVVGLYQPEFRRDLRQIA